MTILRVLVAGIVVGFLGKWAVPGGKNNTPLWLTTLCGIVGGLVGWLLYVAFDDNSFDSWTCWIVVVVCAVIPVLIAAILTARNKVNFPH